ncbi:hypothetical protein ZWY2020_052417 [Hordeum vulgare]|nr:hypothetical protein ZWY2020_052417 [Hordeum vulgare]
MTLMTKCFNDDQKKATCYMGMQSLMNVLCSNLVNHVCDWLREIYDTASKEFVMPGRGGLPLDEIVPRLFPDDATMPNETVLATSLEKMKTHGDVFKMKLLMYLISSIFVPTTSLRPSSKCFPILVGIDDVKNMNWCKFIAHFLHDALSNKMYRKGCHLHLMVCLPPHKFAFSASTYDVVKVLLAADGIINTKYGKLQLMAKHATDYSVFGGPSNSAKWMDARAPVEHLVGQVASGMTSLLGKLVEARTHHPSGCRGRYGYNSSQEHPDIQDDNFVGGLGAMDAGLERGPDGHDVTENVQHGSDEFKSREFLLAVTMARLQMLLMHRRGQCINRRDWRGCFSLKEGRTTEDLAQGPDGKKLRIDHVAARMRVQNKGKRVWKSRYDGDVSVPTPVGISLTRSSPRASLSNTGDPIVLEDMRKQSKWVNKTISCPTKATNKDPLKRIHSKLATSSNVEIHVLPVNKPVVTVPNVATSFDAPKHSFVPAVEVLRASLPPRRSPRKNPTKAYIAVEVVKSRPDTGFVSASTLFPPFEQSKSTGMMEVGILRVVSCKHDSSDGAACTQLTAPLTTHKDPNLNLRTSKIPINVGVLYTPNKNIVKKDVIEITDRSPRPTNKSNSRATFDSDMFVQLSPLDSANQFMRKPCEPHKRHPMDFTPPSCSLGIDHSQDETPIDPEPVAFAFLVGKAPTIAPPILDDRKAVKFVEPIGQATPEVISSPVEEAYRRIEHDAIKKRILGNQGQPSSADPADLVPDDVITSATRGSVKKARVVHAQVVDDCHVPMFQHLAPKNSIDNCGHHYTMCLDLKHQQFEVLDSLCSGDNTSLTSHAELFVSNLKETWNRHYESSKVYECEYYVLGYLGKWEGIKVQAISKASVVELRKILTWNWVTNGDFNERPPAQISSMKLSKPPARSTSDHVMADPPCLTFCVG